MFSRFICITECVGISSLLWLNNINVFCLSIHLRMHIWGVSTFWLCEKCCCKQRCTWIYLSSCFQQKDPLFFCKFLSFIQKECLARLQSLGIYPGPQLGFGYCSSHLFDFRSMRYSFLPALCAWNCISQTPLPSGFQAVLANVKH